MIISTGKYVSWDKFPNDIFKGWSGAGSISKNFRAAISIHLANAWSSGCPVYYWNTIKRQCEMGKHDDIFNNKVKIIADNGNCVEYDFLTNTLVARRKDCNMGLSIFTFFAKDGFYSLQLVNKNRTLGSLKEDASMSLVPPTTILSQNFVFAPSNHILFTDESLDRKYAFVDTSATGGGKIGFKKQTPLKDQHEFKFYLEVYDGSRIGNPLSSQAEWKDFMVKYNSHYKAPFFRIITPFFGENMVIKPVAAKAPEPPKPEMPW